MVKILQRSVVTQTKHFDASTYSKNVPRGSIFQLPSQHFL